MIRPSMSEDHELAPFNPLARLSKSSVNITEVKGSMETHKALFGGGYSPA
jgi:hypothetical protein